MHNKELMLYLIHHSTYVENVNNGLAPQSDYFGAKTAGAMVYSKNSLYNNPNTIHADMTKPQSHFMNLKQGTK